MDTNQLEHLLKTLERIAVAVERIASRQNEIQTESSPADPAPCPNATPAGATMEPKPAAELKPPAVAELEPLLKSRGIQLRSVPESKPADATLDGIADYMGKHYNSVRELVDTIKRCMQIGGGFKLDLAEYSQHDISCVCQLSTRLHKIAFLEDYRYLRAPQRLVTAKTTTLPRAQGFFAGVWLERFILNVVKSAFSAAASIQPPKLHDVYLANPHVTLPNGDQSELDLLGKLGERHFWVEAKSGDYQRYAAKYSKFARLLGLPPSNCFMVLLDTADTDCIALSDIFGMAVTTAEKFEAAFRANLLDAATGSLVQCPAPNL